LIDAKGIRVMEQGSRRKPLKLGLQLPEVEYVASWRDYLEIARTAEAIGLDSLWLGDHLLYRYPGEPARGPWECWSLLSALAAATSRVELGPLVLCAGFRNPALTAKMAETVDEISGGRLILGLGAGWHEPEYSAFGYPFDYRFARFSESFQIIRSLLREGTVDFEGQFHAARDCELIPRGPRAGRIPLMVGSNGEKMLRLTLPHVDQWNIWFADFGNSIEGLRPFMERVDRICGEVGRNPAEVERTAALLVTAPGGAFRDTGAQGERAVSGIGGTSEEVAASLREFHAAGITHIQIVLDPITPPAVEWLAPVVEAVRQG
jgi:alkanesulfonate monooxygenase SsuD/methylene tetrahydromethanopterin reductase-like flavin-dependent oxidoreductase (luciferase family)